MQFKPFDPEADRKTSRRRLPHWAQSAVTYFVTFRLIDSLPTAKREEWQESRLRWLKARGIQDVSGLVRLPEHEQREFHEHLTTKMQELIDQGHGECWLKRPEVAEEVANVLKFFDGDRYVLGRFVIMPNHVHVLVTPAPRIALSDVLQSWKSFSAKRINELVGKPGPVWLDENFDHIVRSEAQLKHFETYIRENPGKGGLEEGTFLLGEGTGMEKGSEPTGPPYENRLEEGVPKLSTSSASSASCAEKMEENCRGFHDAAIPCCVSG